MNQNLRPYQKTILNAYKRRLKYLSRTDIIEMKVEQARRKRLKRDYIQNARISYPTPRGRFVSILFEINIRRKLIKSFPNSREVLLNQYKELIEILKRQIYNTL